MPKSKVKTEAPVMEEPLLDEVAPTIQLLIVQVTAGNLYKRRNGETFKVIQTPEVDSYISLGLLSVIGTVEVPEDHAPYYTLKAQAMCGCGRS